MTCYFKTYLGLFTVATTALLAGCTAPNYKPNPNYKSGVNIHEQRTIGSSSVTYPDSRNNIAKNRQVSSPKANTDSIGVLIRDAEEEYESDHLTIEQNRRIGSSDSSSYPYPSSALDTTLAYKQWLDRSAYRAGEVTQYLRYLNDYIGRSEVPPAEQLLSTARSWEKCGYEQFQLPPRELWPNMVRTVQLYDELKRQGVIPASAEIRSAYRSPDLNACAGGAPGSKHMTNGAIDIWVPEYEGQPWLNSILQDRLCQFWSARGESYNFGLGLYSTGAIHIDTQGYRYWGTQNSRYDSPCRYLNSN